MGKTLGGFASSWQNNKKQPHSIKQSINLLLLALELERNTTLPIRFQKQPF
jgi:hypothetical protein